MVRTTRHDDGDSSRGARGSQGDDYEFFILAVSVLSIVNMVLLATLSFGSQYWWLVGYVDSILTIVFVFDFSYRLRTAPGA